MLADPEPGERAGRRQAPWYPWSLARNTTGGAPAAALRPQALCSGRRQGAAGLLFVRQAQEREENGRAEQIQSDWPIGLGAKRQFRCPVK